MGVPPVITYLSRIFPFTKTIPWARWGYFHDERETTMAGHGFSPSPRTWPWKITGTPVWTMWKLRWFSGWWFGCHFLFSHILGIIIPIDSHIFQRGSNHQPVFHYSLLGGELPHVHRFCGLVKTRSLFQWTTCPHKNPIEITRVN